MENNNCMYQNLNDCDEPVYQSDDTIPEVCSVRASTLQGIADAIRTKTGKSEKIPVSELASEIENGMSASPMGSIELTENGIYDVTALESVTVNVPLDLTGDWFFNASVDTASINNVYDISFTSGRMRYERMVFDETGITYMSQEGDFSAYTVDSGWQNETCRYITIEAIADDMDAVIRANAVRGSAYWDGTVFIE